MSEFNWIRDRFDRVDKDNQEIKDSLTILSTTVTQHGVYWSIVKWCVVSGGGLVASLLAFLGFQKHP